MRGLRQEKELEKEGEHILPDSLLFQLSYRRKMPVTEIRIFSSPHGQTGYYICPRCSVTLEREFMAFCDRCGQRLDWRGYKKAKKVFTPKVPI